MYIILWLLFGAVVGWLAGVVMNDQKSLVMNIIIGILGSLLGSWIASALFNQTYGNFTIEGLLFSVLGAAILIFLKRMVTGKGF